MKRRAGDSGTRGLWSLRKFVQKAPEAERCDLCSAVIAEHHQHLVDPLARRMLCACDACAILFSTGAGTNYRRAPRDARYLEGFNLSDQAWNALGIPIGLAFLYRSSVSDQMLAVYPSPAGPTESKVDAERWNDMLEENSLLAKLTPDVEALLVNRMNGAREYFLAPIDECYRLVGLVRKYWRGFSGGEEGWEQIRQFFAQLKERSYPVSAGSYARSFV